MARIADKASTFAVEVGNPLFQWGCGKRLLFLCGFALATVSFPDRPNAQFAEAHHYDNVPVGVNQLELA